MDIEEEVDLYDPVIPEEGELFGNELLNANYVVVPESDVNPQALVDQLDPRQTEG